MKNKATIIHHQGFGDLFTSNAICMYYANKFDKLTVLVSSESRLKVVNSIYKDVPNIDCQVAKITNFYNGKDACLNCMTLGHPHYCPRDRSVCKFIDYSDFHNYENIKIGCFHDYFSWSTFLNKRIQEGSSFSHSFYEFHNISLNQRIENFYLSEDKTSEKKYNKFLSDFPGDYIVIHDDSSRGYALKKVNSSLPIYNLNMKSDNFLDQIKILENAKELHFIDSSYSVLIYFLSFHNEKIRKIPKFLHTLG
ncbi:MAG: hypothetical protein ACW98X_25775, partial [Promethearchaeota archaeon]